MSRHLEGTLVVGLLLVTLYFATDRLVGSPPTWFDEGIYIQVAMNDAITGAQQIQIAPETFVSPAFVTGGFTFLKPISFAFQVSGPSLVTARSVMVVFILLAVFTFWWCIRRAYGASVALWSLLLLVTFPPLYGQGKNVLGEVPGLFFLALFLLALTRIEQQAFRGRAWYVLAGLAAGLCVVTKPVFLVLGGAVLVAALLYRKSLVLYWDHIALGFVAFLLPLLYWLISQFWSGDSVVHILGYYANPYGIQNIFEQMYVNLLRFVTEVSPAYFALLMAIWIVSVFVRVRRGGTVLIAECVALTFSMLVWLAYLRTAGWYRYFFLAEVVALAYTPHALRELFRVLPRWAPRTASLFTIPILLLALAHVYQLQSGSWIATQDASESVRTLESRLKSLPNESSFFLLSVPEVAVFLPNTNYYQYLILGLGTQSLGLGSDELEVLKKGIPDFVITSDKEDRKEFSPYLQNYTTSELIGRWYIHTRNQ